jgi:hypothetical protein
LPIIKTALAAIIEITPGEKVPDDVELGDNDDVDANGGMPWGDTSAPNNCKCFSCAHFFLLLLFFIICILKVFISFSAYTSSLPQINRGKP